MDKNKNVWVVTYKDEPTGTTVVTVFGNECAARAMEYYYSTKMQNVSDITIDECPIYNGFLPKI